MSNKITVRRGTSAPTDQTLSSGEFGYDLTHKKLYMGNGIGNAPTLVNPDVPVYAGATVGGNGVIGLVPSALTSQRLFFLRGDGSWSEVSLPSDYVGAAAGAAGIHGLVPSAAPSQAGFFLKGDGTWASVVTDIPDATNTVSGKVNTTAQSFAGIKTFANTTDATSTTTGALIVSGGVGIAKTLRAVDVYGGNWNDYAEFRQSIDDTFYQAGTCVCETGDDTLTLSTKRLQAGAMIVSDTYGFAIGETLIARTPVAVSGRVLAKTYRNRNKFKAGQPVCAAPNGTVDRMTRLETILYPDRIIGFVSCVPNYKNWGQREVEVNDRVWIYIK